MLGFLEFPDTTLNTIPRHSRVFLATHWSTNLTTFSILSQPEHTGPSRPRSAVQQISSRLASKGMIEDVFIRHGTLMPRTNLPTFTSLEIKQEDAHLLAGFFCSFPFTLDRPIPVLCSPRTLTDLLLSHNYVSATRTGWCKWLFTIVAICWPTPFSQSSPQPLYQHEASHQLFRPYTSPNHSVTKGRYITSNDPRGYMFVFSGALIRHTL